MKILSILTQSKEEKEKKAAERVARALRRGQEALIDKKEARKDDLQAKIDKLLSISINADISKWNEEYHDAKVELDVITEEINIAKETLTELFSDSKK